MTGEATITVCLVVVCVAWLIRQLRAALAQFRRELGMTLEGCIRSNRCVRDEFADDMCYGLLRSEWIAG